LAHLLDYVGRARHASGGVEDRIAQEHCVAHEGIVSYQGRDPTLR